MSEPSAPLPTQQNPGNKAAKQRLNVCNLFGATTHSTRRRPPALEIWHFGTFAVPGYDGPAHLVNKLQQKALRTVLLLLLQQPEQHCFHEVRFVIFTRVYSNV